MCSTAALEAGTVGNPFEPQIRTPGYIPRFSQNALVSAKAALKLQRSGHVTSLLRLSRELRRPGRGGGGKGEEGGSVEGEGWELEEWKRREEGAASCVCVCVRVRVCHTVVARRVWAGATRTCHVTS
eukprot:3921043-Rhodomonas_salina.2